MTYFVYLNGPPKSGKDTIANLLAEKYENVVHVKFTQMLRDAVCSIFGIDEADFERQKDKHDALRFDSMKIWPGMSYREFVIRLSDKVLKPNFGKGYLGLSLVRQFDAYYDDIEGKTGSEVFIVSDLGFPEELNAFRDKAVPYDELLIHLYRKGRNFDNDSRDYVTGVIQPVTIHNDGLIGDTVREVESLIRDMLIHYNDSLRESK